MKTAQPSESRSSESLDFNFSLQRPLPLASITNAHALMVNMKQIYKSIADDYHGKSGADAEYYTSLFTGVSSACDVLLEMTNESTRLTANQAKRVENIILNIARKTQVDILQHPVGATITLMPLATYINTCIAPSEVAPD